MSETQIAIDPGTNGGIAWSYGNEPVDAVRMPKTMTEIHSKLQEIASAHPTTRVLIEKTGTYRSGNSGPSAAKFARHCGQIEALVYALSLSSDEIPANRWMKKFLGTVPKDKSERKYKIKEKAQRLYPHLAVTLATSDALGLLTVLMGNSAEK